MIQLKIFHRHNSGFYLEVLDVYLAEFGTSLSEHHQQFQKSLTGLSSTLNGVPCPAMMKLVPCPAMVNLMPFPAMMNLVPFLAMMNLVPFLAMMNLVSFLAMNLMPFSCHDELGPFCCLDEFDTLSSSQLKSIIMI